MLTLSVILTLILLSPFAVWVWHHERDRIIRYARVCLSCMAHAIGLHLIPKRHRRIAHIGILGVIAWDLVHVGWKVADLGFLMLSALVEAEDSATFEDRKVHKTEFPTAKGEPSITIPNAQIYFDRLSAWILANGIKIVSWSVAERDAPGPSIDHAMGVSWVRDGDTTNGQHYISVRTDMSIDRQLHALIHELAHVLSFVRKDYDRHFSGKNARDTGMPCWLTRFAILDPNFAVETAIEREAEMTTRQVCVRMRWPECVAYADEYLERYPSVIIPGTSFVDLTCAEINIDRNVDLITSVFNGDDHVTQH